MVDPAKDKHQPSPTTRQNFQLILFGLKHIFSIRFECSFIVKKKELNPSKLQGFMGSLMSYRERNEELN